MRKGPQPPVDRQPALDASALKAFNRSDRKAAMPLRNGKKPRAVKKVRGK